VREVSAPLAVPRADKERALIIGDKGVTAGVDGIACWIRDTQSGRKEVLIRPRVSISCRSRTSVAASATKKLGMVSSGYCDRKPPVFFFIFLGCSGGSFTAAREDLRVALATGCEPSLSFRNSNSASTGFLRIINAGAFGFEGSFAASSVVFLGMAFTVFLVNGFCDVNQSE
jgi:hypothetical protein